MIIDRIFQPTSIKEAYQILISYPDAVIIGGGAWLKFQSPKLPFAIDLSKLNLNRIQETKTFIEIGAMTTLYDLECHVGIQELFRGFLSKAFGQVLGVPFRNIATIGGSIYGKYAFSDIITPLLCLDVTLNFYKREPMSLVEFLDHKDKIEDILLSILIRKDQGSGFFKKVSNTPLDFSIVNIGVTYSHQQFKIAVGARPGLAKCPLNALSFLNQSNPNEPGVIEKAAAMAVDELTFGTNHLASDAYRKEVAKVYIVRGIKEVYSV